MKVLEKVIQSNFPPTRQDVVWIDTSDVQNPVVKLYVNGEWKLASSESADVQHLQQEIDEIIEQLAGEGGTIEDLGEIRTKALAAVAGNGITNVTSLTKEEYDALEEKDPETLYIVKSDPTNGHEWVDIGAVDDEGYHIIWATKNIGAENPWDAGKYFAWGDTVGYYADDGHDFSRENAPYWDSNNQEYAKYNDEDSLTELQPEDDAAHVQWGGKWRVPLSSDFDNTYNESDILEKIVDHDIVCVKYYDIIFPLCGQYDGSSIEYINQYGQYWSSTREYQYDLYTCDFYYAEDGFGIENDIDREFGQSIRPIIKVKDLSELDPTYDIYLGEDKIVDNGNKERVKYEKVYAVCRCDGGVDNEQERVSTEGGTLYLKMFNPSTFVENDKQFQIPENGVVELDIPYGYIYQLHFTLPRYSASFRLVNTACTQVRYVHLWNFAIGVNNIGYVSMPDHDEEIYRSYPLVSATIDDMFNFVDWDFENGDKYDYDGRETTDGYIEENDSIGVLVATADCTFAITPGWKASGDKYWSKQNYGKSIPGLEEFYNTHGKDWDAAKEAARLDLNGNLNSEKMLTVLRDAPALMFAALTPGYKYESYLPSAGELCVLYTNKAAINDLLIHYWDGDIATIDNSSCWSSSTSDANSSFFYNLTNGFVYNSNKNIDYPVFAFSAIHFIS